MAYTIIIMHILCTCIAVMSVFLGILIMHVLLVVNIVIIFTIILFIEAKKNVQKKLKKIVLLWVVLLIVSLATTAVVGGVLFKPAFITHTSIMIPMQRDLKPFYISGPVYSTSGFA